MLYTIPLSSGEIANDEVAGWWDGRVVRWPGGEIAGWWDSRGEVAGGEIAGGEMSGNPKQGRRSILTIKPIVARWLEIRQGLKSAAVAEKQVN